MYAELAWELECRDWATQIREGPREPEHADTLRRPKKTPQRVRLMNLGINCLFLNWRYEGKDRGWK